MQNFSVREQIRDYWSERARNYDDSAGHGVQPGAERQAWLDLIAAHLGPAGGRRALDLASGTGEMSMLLASAGFSVTGIDFAEPMLERARAKAEAAGLPIRYLLRDVENTHEPDAAYDVLFTRNLVWTLVDPNSAFREWRRLLKPGGMLVVLDGDHVSTSWADALHEWWDKAFGTPPHGHSLLTEAQWQAHRDIVAQLHFNAGARAPLVAQLLEGAGFVDLTIDTRLSPLRAAQSASQNWTGRLRQALRHRFLITAVNPDSAG